MYKSRWASGHRLILVRPRESTSPQPELLGLGHRTPTLIFPSGHRQTSRRFKTADCSRYKPFLRYLKKPLPRQIFYRHDSKDSPENCLISSPCSSHERPPPSRLSLLRGELLSPSWSGGHQRRLPQLHARIFGYSTGPNSNSRWTWAASSHFQQNFLKLSGYQVFFIEPFKIHCRNLAWLIIYDPLRKSKISINLQIEKPDKTIKI